MKVAGYAILAPIMTLEYGWYAKLVIPFAFFYNQSAGSTPRSTQSGAWRLLIRPSELDLPATRG